MKRILIAAILTVAISAASFSKETVAKGQTHSALGTYKIEKADNPITVNGEELRTFVISYQNSPLKVTVAIRKDRKCKTYYVLSDKLSVKYVCNENYFGVEKLKSLATDGFTTSDEALNRSEYFHQKVIAPGYGPEIENTQLIAAYFPMLIREEVLAAK